MILRPTSTVVGFLFAALAAACATGGGDDAGANGEGGSDRGDGAPQAQDGSPNTDAGHKPDSGADAGGGDSASDAEADADADAAADSDAGADADSDADSGADSGADATMDSGADSDAGPLDASDGGVLGPPCLYGSGWTAWRFHYDQNNGTSAILDVYSLPDNSNWEAVPAFATQFDDALHGGGLSLGSGNWILIRYSIAGLTQINSATLSIYGRSYDVSASGSFDGWTPLYGDNAAPTDSLSNAWPYTSDSIDFTGSLHIGDDPNLTGIRLYSGPSSDSLIVNTVELCIDGF